MLRYWTALNSGMGRRALALIGASLATLLFAFVCVEARESGHAADVAQQQRLEGTSRRIASTLTARIEAADAIITTITDRDVGPDGLLARERLDTTHAFRGLLLLQPDERGRAQSGVLAFQMTQAQLSALRSQRSVVVSVSIGDDDAALYLLRQARAAGREQIAAFELAPQWLWGDDPVRTPGFHVLTANAGALYASPDGGRDFRALFEAQFRQGLRPGEARPLAWHASGGPWIGVMAALSPLESYGGPTLAVIAAERRPALWSRVVTIAHVLPLLLLVAAALAVVATVQLVGAYLPAMISLRRGFAELRAERAVTLRETSARDEVRGLIDGFNQSAAAVLRRSQTLRTLGEIDSLLLGAGELESALDDVLARVREVTRSRAVGFALIDGTEPPHGRIFVTSRGGEPLPVSRIDLDAALLETLHESAEGLTIARCEEDRHSLLAPLQQVGRPVLLGMAGLRRRPARRDALGRLRRCRQADASLAHYGTECALRLGATLSSECARRAAVPAGPFRSADAAAEPAAVPRPARAGDSPPSATDARRGALLYVDLDHFKKINDSLGHDAGDQVLAIIAQRLRACVKDGDTVARLAGDEFTVILRQVVDPPRSRARSPTASSSRCSCRSASAGRITRCARASASRCSRTTARTSTS